MRNTLIKRKLSQALIIALVVLLNACALHSGKHHDKESLANSSPQYSQLTSHQVLLGSLLGTIDIKHFFYTDQHGVKKYDELRHFKALEKIYIASLEKQPPLNHLTEKQLKTLMFFSFYATEKNSAAFLEYLAADLMTVYNSQPVDFLQTLNQLPFMIKSNCNRLNANFGFEGKNLDTKPSFLTNNKAKFQQYLSSANASTCLDAFK